MVLVAASQACCEVRQQICNEQLDPNLLLACFLHAAAVVAASDAADLPREQKLALLKRLRKAMKQMYAQLRRAEAGPGSQVHFVIVLSGRTSLTVSKPEIGLFARLQVVSNMHAIAC